MRRDVMVEMRDGVTLATDVHLPQEGESFPTLVHRTPYNKAEDVPVGTIPTAVENGYAVVQQDVRGRFASNGWFVPFSEGEDGYDTIEWVAEQSWSTGQVGMYGTSYRGMTTIQAMKEEPPSLVAAAPLVTPANFYHDLQYSGGANNLGTSMAWTASNSFSQISRLNVSESEANALREQLQALFQNWPDSAAQLPEIDISAFDQGVAPYWRDWLEHPTFDNYWQAIDVLAEVGDLSIPMVQAGGWYDIFLDGTTSLFSAVEERAPEVVRENQRLVIGPWSHLTYPSADPVGDRDFGSEAAYDLSGELVFPWFDYWLKDEGDGVRSLPKVQYFQMGADEWRSADEWPPSSSTPTDYYLDGDIPDDGVSSGGLSTNEPAAEDATDSYDYDPLDPVPTRGGPLHMGPLQTAGVVDQTPVEERDDVLVYTSEALSESVAIAGDVEATLFVETTAPDTDFVARLVDVGPDGYSMNVTEGVLRARYRESFEEPEFLEAGVVYELTVDLRPVAHTFESGHRIRLDVTSSNFPKLDRNPNTAITVSRATEEDMQTATQTLHRSSNYPSRLQLPVDSA
ncbi:CocE/NonD family hydrolase [Haloferax denitrificans]|uniref:CocE/NonD family hydrolase n=1 Tax=Haloferax denitrificans TaxID=35745 RepID=UPI003C6EB69A